MGEMVAWLVGWALILEYALGASAVAVGWSGYIVGLLDTSGSISPCAEGRAPDQWGFLQGGEVGGVINLPAVIIVGLGHHLLVIGTKESAHLQRGAGADQGYGADAFPHHHAADDQRPREQLPPVHSARLGQSFELLGTGMFGAAASIFFAYVGFDAVSTAAEETKNPQRNVPIGLIGSLLICTVFYLLVAAGVVGAIRRAAGDGSARPGFAFKEGSPELYASAVLPGGACADGLLEGSAGACPARGRLTRCSATSSASRRPSRCLRSCC